MTPALLSVIIILIALVLFLVPRIPMTITALLCMVAMPLFGLTSFSSAYAGFANTAAIMVAALCVVGQALVDTGVAQKIGTVISKATGGKEWLFILLCLVLGCTLSAFLNGAIVVALLLPICDSLVISSNGAITRKHCYLPIGLQGPLGNNLTGISASSMVTCSAVLMEAGYRGIGMFEPTKIALPSLIIVIAVYMLVAYPLSKKWLDYPDPPILGATGVVDTDSEEYKKAHPTWKMVVAVITLVCTMVAMARGANWGAATIIAACVVVLTGCVTPKKAMSSISWTTYLIIAASIGFSAGLKDSGGGALVANWLINIAGPLAETPFGMCIVMFVVAGLISQVMADGGSVACTIPITLAVAQTQGWDPIPMAICTAMGVKTALATPICVSCVTMAAPGGYRFKDYVKIGGIVTITSMITILILTYFVYYA